MEVYTWVHLNTSHSEISNSINAKLLGNELKLKNNTFVLLKLKINKPKSSYLGEVDGIIH